MPNKKCQYKGKLVLGKEWFFKCGSDQFGVSVYPAETTYGGLVQCTLSYLTESSNLANRELANCVCSSTLACIHRITPEVEVGHLPQ